MGSTDVSILLGNGSGGFSPASGSPVTVGDYPFGVAVGDFNGDGDADLAVANWGSDDVSILPGNGSGGFSAPGSPVAVGTRPYYVTVADFFSGTTLLGTATTAGSTASLTTSALPVGTTAITAVYSGDANFVTSISTLSPVVTSAADFTLASSTGQQLIPPGASANFTIVVTSMNGPITNVVTMSASNLPAGATYRFSPATVAPVAAGASTTFTVSVPKQSSKASSSRRLGSLGFALLLLPFACHKRHRARPQRFLVWMMLPTLTSLGVVSGCGEGGYFSQSEQTYTITVTGTSGNLVRNTTVTLTVE